jgi:hypothetical protein
MCALSYPRFGGIYKKVPPQLPAGTPLKKVDLAGFYLALVSSFSPGSGAIKAGVVNIEIYLISAQCALVSSNFGISSLACWVLLLSDLFRLSGLGLGISSVCISPSSSSPRSQVLLRY